MSHARNELTHRGQLGRLDELGLGFLERAEPGARLLVQAGIVECQRRLVRERFQQRDVGRGEDAPHSIAHGEGADDLAPHTQRDAQHGARLAVRRIVPQLVAEDDRGVVPEIRRPHRPALQHRAARHARPRGSGFSGPTWSGTSPLQASARSDPSGSLRRSREKATTSSEHTPSTTRRPTSTTSRLSVRLRATRDSCSASRRRPVAST